VGVSTQVEKVSESFAVSYSMTRTVRIGAKLIELGGGHLLILYGILILTDGIL